MKRSYLLVTVAVLAATLVAPATATAFQITGGGGTQTQNPYGLWYAGQEACAIEGCHSVIAAKPSPHGNMVTDVKAFPSKLIPAAGDTAFWPYTGPFGGLVLRPRDMYLQVGDNHGFLEYIGANPSSLATNIVPPDDIFVWSPMEYLFGEHGAEGEWAETTAPIAYSSYSQSCSGCHNLGVTRPSNATYTLPGVPSPQTTASPSSVSAFSIQCEVCHGTGENPDGHKKGVPSVVGGKQMLKSQVCGQCHVGGTTPQKNAKGSAFGNPNGYTTDATLTAFLTPFTTVESETTFMNFINNGGTKPKFLPNGADYSMRHPYYNEWLVNKTPSQYGGSKGHADPLNNAIVNYNNPKCLKCHSGLGFLNRIGATSPSGKRIVATFPSISEVATSDPGISCQVCHTGHVGYSPEGGYDSQRRWANGRTVDCGDCHNWQFEMLGQPLQSETIEGVSYSRPSANSYTRHAQREMLTGGAGGEDGDGGMWGVAPMGKFMPDATCADCHMPRTHREGMPANDDGNTEGTRQSHRFRVVQPGDAERWKLRPNGDSCVTTCHKKDAATYTRAEMQTWIDVRRSEVGTASDDATHSLDAAAVGVGLAGWRSLLAAQPATGSAAAMSSSSWKMLQHAAQNADFVIGDGSGGIHNPAYALAGLRKAVYWARSSSVSIDSTLGTGPFKGAGMTASGTLRGMNGSVIPGAEVALHVSADGGSTWSLVTTGAPSPTTGAFALPTGTIVGSKIFRVSFTPSPGVVYTAPLMPVTVPVTTASYLPATAPDGWLNAPLVTVTLSATPGSLTFYSLGGATTRPQSVYIGPLSITAEGLSTLTYWSSTGQGTEAPKSVAVRLDRAAPVVSTDGVADYLDGATVKVWATDTGSGIAKLEYSLDGAAYKTATSTWASVATSKLGAHSLIARATDKSGRATSRTIAFKVRTQPKIAVTPTGSSYTVGVNKTITLGATVRTKSGARVVRKAVYLQKSTNGTSWSHYTSRTTNSSGQVSFGVKPTRRGTVYWRWYVPQSDSYRTVSGPKVRIVAP